MAMQLPEDFKDFLKLLNELNIQYLVVGGYAVGYYGYPRATNDLDVWIAVHPENAMKLVSAIRRFGFSNDQISENLFLIENNIVRMGNPPMRIEIITTASGVDFEACYKNRKQDWIDSIPVNFIGLDDLKKNKKASGRFKDQDDLENLPS